MSFLKISKYINFFRSIFSIININILIKVKSKKAVFFYFSRKDLTLKDIDYITDLLKKLNNKYLILYGHKLNDIYKEKFFFINEGLIKFIFNVDLFVSNYICDVFTKDSKRLYIHHALYDTPLTGKKKEKETINRLKKYNYIFLSSKSLVKSFSKLFLKKNHHNSLVVKSTGYPRFDYFNKIVTKKKDSIIIAPANFVAYPDHTLVHNLDNIISIILNKFKFNVILRPHPANRVYFKSKSHENKNCKYFEEIFK